MDHVEVCVPATIMPSVKRVVWRNCGPLLEYPELAANTLSDDWPSYLVLHDASAWGTLALPFLVLGNLRPSKHGTSQRLSYAAVR